MKIFNHKRIPVCRGQKNTEVSNPDIYIPKRIFNSTAQTAALLDAEGLSPGDVPKLTSLEIDLRFTDIAQKYDGDIDPLTKQIESLVFNEETIVKRCLENPTYFIRHAVTQLSTIYGPRSFTGVYEGQAVQRFGTRNANRNGIDLGMTAARRDGVTTTTIETTLQGLSTLPIIFESDPDKLTVKAGAYKRGSYDRITIDEQDPRRERLVGELARMLWVTNISLLWSDEKSRAPRNNQAKQLLIGHRANIEGLPRCFVADEGQLLSETDTSRYTR